MRGICCTLLLFWTSLAFGQISDQLNLIGQASLPSTATDVWGYFDEATNTEYAIIGTFGQGIFIYDVSDPTQPNMVANMDTVAGFDMKIYQNYLYTVNGGDFGDGSIIDLTDPTNPVRRATFPSAHNIWITDDGLLIAKCTGMQIYDLTVNPLAPQFLFDDFTSQCHDAIVVDDILYDFHGTDGTFIYSITDPSDPQIMGVIDDFSIVYHHSGDQSEDGNYLYICDELSGQSATPGPDITIWDISDPNDPNKVNEISSSTATVHNLYVIGDRMYVSFYADGIKIYDVSNPAIPTLVDEFDTSPNASEGFSGAFGIYPFAPSGNIYVSDMQAGLMIFGDPISTSIETPPDDQFAISLFPNP
ncbi:MAG: choice-of-anchor B family protein, partial [Bacteroidota bacterium]